MANGSNHSNIYAYRYLYFQKYIAYSKEINIKNIKNLNIKNKKRFDYYNLYSKYTNKSSKIIKPKNINTIFNNDNIDLTGNSLFIKGTSINSLKNLSSKSSPTIKSTGTNTINVLDLLLPSFDSKFGKYPINATESAANSL